MQIIREKQDMRYLKWSRIRQSSGTAGSFLKSYEVINGRKRYYKLSDYDPLYGIVGHECVNEIIAGRLMDVLGMPHLEYSLIHAQIVIDEKEYDTWLNASDDFKRPGESKLAIEDYYFNARYPEETTMAFAERMGWLDHIFQMIYLDFLILNRDRHGANIEVLRLADERQVRLAPFFDQGLSLLCRCHKSSEVSDYDVMSDMPVQAFFGSRSVLENLKMIPKKELSLLCKKGIGTRDGLFDGLEDILMVEYYDKIWEMISRRFEYACSI